MDEHSIETLDRIQQRVLWLAVRMIDEANRGSHEIKAGGHPASCASMTSLTTALWFGHLERDDLVSVKPHGAPVYHAIQYLLGQIDEQQLRSLRMFHGLQPYPSRTKDPEPPDFTTGSVGLGSIAPLFSALTERWLDSHGFDAVPRRFISIMGDAELDEGSTWEAIHEPMFLDLDRVLWIVDVNRQSLDRFIPQRTTERIGAMFRGAGWSVIDLPFDFARLGKHGRRIGEAIMRLDPAHLLPIVAHDPAAMRDGLAMLLSAEQNALLDHVDLGELQSVLRTSGGHDLGAILSAYRQADDIAGPVVILADTIKGWGLPIAANQLNHAALLDHKQIGELRTRSGLTEDDEWARFPDDTPEGRLSREVAVKLRRAPLPVESLPPPADIPVPKPSGSSTTQQVFGRALAHFGDDQAIGARIITASPDVAISTNLGGWINKAGVFTPTEPAIVDMPAATAALKWQRGPTGRHIELGIAEINLFILLGQLGMADQHFGTRLIPIGTLYDPFVLRGLDAFIYSLYAGADFIVVGTPSGISLSYEGGSHQSFATASVGLELPNLITYEPAFAADTIWVLHEAIHSVASEHESGSFYLRLSTRPIPQELTGEALVRLGESNLRDHVVKGGYVLHESTIEGPPVVIAVAGPPVVEVMDAAIELEESEGIHVHVVSITSNDLLFQGWHSSDAATDRGEYPGEPGHLATLIPPHLREAPIITVHDASPHAMAWLGSVYGQPAHPLGPVRFGEAGSIADLYDAHRLSARKIINAVIGAL